MSLFLYSDLLTFIMGGVGGVRTDGLLSLIVDSSLKRGERGSVVVRGSTWKFALICVFCFAFFFFYYR